MSEILKNEVGPVTANRIVAISHSFTRGGHFYKQFVAEFRFNKEFESENLVEIHQLRASSAQADDTCLTMADMDLLVEQYQQFKSAIFNAQCAEERRLEDVQEEINELLQANPYIDYTKTIDENGDERFELKAPWVQWDATRYGRDTALDNLKEIVAYIEKENAVVDAVVEAATEKVGNVFSVQCHDTDFSRRRFWKIETKVGDGLSDREWQPEAVGRYLALTLVPYIQYCKKEHELQPMPPIIPPLDTDDN